MAPRSACICKKGSVKIFVLADLGECEREGGLGGASVELEV